MEPEPTLPTPKKGRAVAATWPDRFLASLRKYANVSAAARTARVSRDHAYATRKADPLFAAAWADALTEATEGLEREAWRRGATGVPRKKGVYYEGVLVGTEATIEYSDTLLIFLLKAHAPAKYRETVRTEHTGADGGPVQVEVADLRERLARRLAAATTGSSPAGLSDEPAG